MHERARGHHLVTDLQKSRRRTRRGHCLQWSVQGVEHKGQFGGVECTQVVADGLAASKNVWARPPAARKARCRDPMPERTTRPHHRRRARHRRTVRYSPPCPARHADPFNIHSSRPTAPLHPADIPHPSHTPPWRTPLTKNHSHAKQPKRGPCRTRTCDLVIRSTQDNPAPVRVVRCFGGSIPRISRASTGRDQLQSASAAAERVVQLAGLRRTS